MSRSAVMCLSGGMDSTGLLVKLLAQDYKVKALSFDYGQKHKIELDRAAANIEYLAAAGIEVQRQVIDLSAAMSGLVSALTQAETDVPEGFYEEENMIATVVPNRNAIFASIAYSVALNDAVQGKKDVDLCLGVHSGDHAIYPDCRPEFYDVLGKAFALGNWDSERVKFYLPFLHGDKTTILQDALAACRDLELDFDVIFANTNTSYNPTEEGQSSGRSGADVERILAFDAIGREDPVSYVGGWEAALDYARQAQQDFQAKG